MLQSLEFDSSRASLTLVRGCWTHRKGTSITTGILTASAVAADLLEQLPAGRVVTGRHYALRTRTVANYTPDVIAALIDAGESQSSPLSVVAVHHFHGAPARVPVESTALGVRRSHYVVEILGAWDPDEDATRHWAWADCVANNLTAHALPGGYANLLGPDDHDQIAHAYGPNAGRLRAAITRFDPDGVFSAIPLPPDPTPGA